MKNGKEYLVAFRGTEAAGGFKGIVTWTAFTSKEDFDKWCAREGKKSLEKAGILEEGITEDRAVELTKSTPIESRITAAMEQAVDPETGKLNREKMFFVAERTAWAIQHSLGLM